MRVDDTKKPDEARLHELLADIGAQKETKEQGGKRYDAGKNPLHLIPAYPLWELGRVYGYGTVKYQKWNWAGGTDWDRVYGCVMRHMLRWYAGEDLDPESGISHLAHAAFSLFQLMEFSKTHPELDNRRKDGAKIDA